MSQNFEDGAPAFPGGADVAAADGLPADGSGSVRDASVPEFGPVGDPFAPVKPALKTAAEIYGQEIPPDNEHGDGVRNPPARPCAGVRGDGLMAPRISVKSEDWRDYNYSDFSY